MLGSNQRLAVRVDRREALGWPVLLSLVLHLTFLLSLLIIPPTPPPSEPLTVDVVVGEAPAAATSGPPAPTEATAAPIAPAAPAQQVETPAPAPDVPPPPPVQQAETPAPAPDVPPPPPVQQTEIPAPTPAPAPAPVPPPPKPVAQVRPPRATPQRAAARASVSPSGSPAHAAAGQNAAGRAGDANNGAAWMGKLKQWWDQHSYYPKEASQTNEGGSVKVRIVIAADGQVMSIEVVQSSGLSVLDAAAVAVFRNAYLPPFPSGTPAQSADVVVTLHYRPADNGG
jgi:protein TonB